MPLAGAPFIKTIRLVKSHGTRLQISQLCDCVSKHSHESWLLTKLNPNFWKYDFLCWVKEMCRYKLKYLVLP